ncbi:hypothetical protein [Scleromatobacter humisilvae]|uniref:Uncharacterized protein n=1 Tax=Scleromatobacter humisilvae TaxID=2897159 RepID=A0A9X1YJG8_9BURK|nr:hypothetical protein [Scleromatobacter humisilvae]MCK9687449.1 hypothetical protein [Scleromatobacter humisilvae]
MTDVERRTLLGLIASPPIFGRCADAGPPSFEPIRAPGSHGAGRAGWPMVGDPVATTAAARAGVDTAGRIVDSAVDADPGQVVLPPVSLEERGDFVVDTASAWPARVAHTRTMHVGAMAQVDSTSFTLT